MTRAANATPNTATTPMSILYLSFTAALLQGTWVRALSSRRATNARACDGTRLVGRERRLAAMNGVAITACRRPQACVAIGVVYSHCVATPAAIHITGMRRIYAWPRLRFTLAVSAAIGFITGLHSKAVMPVDLLRALLLGAVVLLVFGGFEQWPRRLPRWLPRTMLRLIGIAVVIPPAAALAFGITGGGSSHDYGLLVVA